jgi:hypothetical protein
MGNHVNKNKPTVSFNKTVVQDQNGANNLTRDVVHVEMTDHKQKIELNFDYDEFVQIMMNPWIELGIGTLAYIIGYKMVYCVDAYRQRIPNVIAIVTLKIKADRNVIYQSENRRNKKEHYELLDLSKRIESDKYFTRDQQGESLTHAKGNMVAWEHSTKYCAHNVETLMLTFCGKFRDVIDACHKYANNMAFAESAYTYEENMPPVVYEVGETNYSTHLNPVIGSGKCLDFFHFFLRPEYAMDYGFWQFQFSDKKIDVNQAEIVMGDSLSD